MREHVVLGAAVLAALASASAGVAAELRAHAGARPALKVFEFDVKLAARQEVPRPKNVPKAAVGNFTATLDGTTLRWTLTFGHLSGKATAAHLHQAGRGKSGP